MQEYTIYFNNIVGTKRAKTFVAKDEISAINKLLDFGGVKKILSITKVEKPSLFSGDNWNDFLSK